MVQDRRCAQIRCRGGYRWARLGSSATQKEPDRLCNLGSFTMSIGRIDDAVWAYRQINRALFFD